MTLEQKIGQRLVGGFPSTTMSEAFIENVKKYKIGNVILFRHNVENEEQLKKLCSDIQELIIAQTGVPAFITIDQEGGAVVRLPATLANVPGAMAITATNNPENAYKAGLVTAKQLRDVGVNFDLAPDMDVNSNPHNPIIGVRSYGETPEHVAEYALQMMQGLVDGNVLASAKHFPGHGDTSTDTHVSLPCVDKSMEELEKVELYPFMQAIKADIPAIMTTHILFPQLEPEKIPATMSRKIMKGILREKLGFKNLIVSDCMEMSAIAKFYGTPQGIVGAIGATVDLVFACHKEENMAKSAQAVKLAIEKGELSMQEMDESVERILHFKNKFKISQPSQETFNLQEAVKFCDELRRETITEVNVPKTPFVMGDNPLCVGCSAFNIVLVGNTIEDMKTTFAKMCNASFGGTEISTLFAPTDEEIENILAVANKHSSILMNTYNAHLHPQQMKLLHKLAETKIPMAAVALRNPYDLKNLPEHVYAIEAYEYTEKSVNLVIELLKGNIEAKGKLPINL